MRIYIGHIGIEIEKIYNRISSFNPTGPDWTHRWEHADGLGFVNPDSGLGHSLCDTINQAKSTVCKSFGWDVDSVEVIRPEKTEEIKK
jgi:hypothetical protein